jgi:hypothetical protein
MERFASSIYPMTAFFFLVSCAKQGHNPNLARRNRTHGSIVKAADFEGVREACCGTGRGPVACVRLHRGCTRQDRGRLNRSAWIPLRTEATT